MPKQPKRIQAWTGDRDAIHSVEDAVKLVKTNATAKFDESIEIAVNLGVDPRHADQQVRGVVSLPGPTSSAPRNWSSASRAASWSSTASSRRRT